MRDFGNMVSPSLGSSCSTIELSARARVNTRSFGSANCVASRFQQVQSVICPSTTVICSCAVDPALIDSASDTCANECISLQFIWVMTTSATMFSLAQSR